MDASLQLFQQNEHAQSIKIGSVQLVHTSILKYNTISNALFDYIFANFAASKCIDWWHPDVITKCGMLPKDGSSFYEEIENASLYCYVYRVYLTFVKVEVLSIDPPLVKLPRFLPKKQIQEWVKLSTSLQLGLLLIKTQDPKNENAYNSARIVNGTFIKHNHSSVTMKTFQYIQNRIPAFDFNRAEKFQILHYRPGGHYALHYDYFKTNHDLERLGNRLATFMVILKRADIGGSTLFPELGVNFNPRVGDAVIWFNMNPDYSCADGSKHGACPVIKVEPLIGKIV
uniref:Fe2OG dioxygenase domain-containing protein n=1 Tax=Panagrellus redivivus TaxID=6233 RepID=A0A7E4UYJ7_PANRE